MQATSRLKNILKLSDREVEEWTDVFREQAQRASREKDRKRLLIELRHDAERYFLAEMDSRFRDEAPLNDSELYSLVHEFLTEIGIKDVPKSR